MTGYIFRVIDNWVARERVEGWFGGDGWVGGGGGGGAECV